MTYYRVEELIERRKNLAGLTDDIKKACFLIINAYNNGGKVLSCGNGGSCSDAGHIVGELMKGFHKKRPLSSKLKDRLMQFDGTELADQLQVPLRAIDLTSMSSLITAIANDMDSSFIFAQQVIGYADPGDVFVGISTSGNSKNVHFAAIAAKATDTVLIGLTGSDGGLMQAGGLYDVIICVPESSTYRIQEEHIAILHAICATVEDSFFSE